MTQRPTKAKRNRRAKQQLNSSALYEKLEPRQLLATFQIIGAGTINNEQISLQIDGQTVRTWNNLGGNALTGQYVTLNHSVAGNVSPDQVRITFNNSVYDPANGIDSNVRIDAIVIDGNRYETEAPNVFSTGTWKSEDGIVPGFRQSEFLHVDGYFQYSETGGSGSIIDIRARGNEGDELFELQINEQTVSSWQVNGNYATYTFQADGSVTPEQIRIAFTNDSYDPGVFDRNLFVDYLEIDGTRYETEAPNVFSTATWKPEDGITPGFRESEILHSNGYFQFGQSAQPGVIRLENSVINVSESDNVANFTIVRENGSDGIVTVDYGTVAISATDGQDFVGRSGTVTFQPGETSKTIPVSLINDSLVEPNEQFSFVIDNVAGGATLLAPRTATATIDDNDSIQAAGDGLLGEYFDGLSFTNRFINRVDPTVNFSWGTGAPVSGMGPNTFSVRWSGQIEPRFNETYTFQTRSDDGVRLWVDNQLIINQWVDQPATNATGTISLLAGQLYDIRMEYYENGGDAVAQLRWSSPSQSLQVIPRSQLYAADPPPPTPGDELQTQTLISGLVQPTSLDFSPDGSKLYVAEQRGIIRVMDNGNLQSSPFLDFRDRVNGTRDRGLLDIAVHPDFENNPYVYLLYTYDPPEVNNQANGSLAGPDGNGNRAGRLTRVTADASNGYRTVVPGSEVVLVGNNSTWNNFNGFANSTNNFSEPPAGILPDGSNLQDFIATDSESHTIGSVEFGPDGALYASIGDGTSYNRVDPRTYRVQDIDNLSGKILRIDPITGQGLSDNPFFNGNRNANRSKVYQYGLRNPFRITVHPDSGDVYIGDVGWTQWEEVNFGSPGANFGWPHYEGASGSNAQTRNYRDLAQSQSFYASGGDATPAIYALNHAADGINAIVLGDVYTGDAFPAEYKGDLFFNDLGQGIVRNISFDANGNITAVDTFTTGAQIVVQMVQGPDDNLYFVDLNDGTVGRWTFVDTGQARVAGAVAPDVPAAGRGDIGYRGAGTTIALIDTGVDFDHPELLGSRWVNSDEIPNDGIDNDGNGYIDDRYGFDFVDSDSNPQDGNGHGTFTAGVISGTEFGLASNARIMALRTLDNGGVGAAADIAKAIRYAVDNGADIVTLPLDTTPHDAILAAIQFAAEQDVLVVVAAGNEAATDPSWLGQLSGQFDNVVSAGAVGLDGIRLAESNQVGTSGATQIDAPGIAFGPLLGGGIGTFRGTSVAAANLASAAALALSINPDLTASQLRDAMVASTDKRGNDSLGQLDPAALTTLARNLTEVSVRVEGDRVFVSTTSGDDLVQVRTDLLSLQINQVRYALPEASTVARLIVNGQSGFDRVELTGTIDSDQGVVQNGYTRLITPGHVVIGKGFESSHLDGNAGTDQITLSTVYDQENLFVANGRVEFLGSDAYRGANSFENIRVVSRTEGNSATLTGTDGNDRLFVTPTLTRVTSSDLFVQINGFTDASVDVGEGFDPAVIRGGHGEDRLTVTPNTVDFQANSNLSSSSQVFIEGIERTTSNGGTALDRLSIYDAAGRDTLNSRPLNSLMVGIGYDHRAYGFETTDIYSSGGSDRASTVIGIDGLLIAGSNSTRLSSNLYSTTLHGFPTLLTQNGGGDSIARFNGTSGDDAFFFSPQLSQFYNDVQQVTVTGFRSVSAAGGGGFDRATFVDGAGDDELTLNGDRATLISPDYTAEITAFDSVQARSQIDAGDDQITQVGDIDFAFEAFGDWSFN